MSTKTAVKERIITVYSSQGKNNNRIPFSGETWGELKSRLSQEGYNISSMKAVENIRKSTLENPKGILPEGDFNLHLFPIKTKSGSNRKELMTGIKAVMSSEGKVGNKAKKHFSEDKSYTNKSTDELEKLATKWNKKNPDNSIEFEATQPVPKAKVKATAPKAARTKATVAKKAEAPVKSEEEKLQELRQEHNEIAEGLEGIHRY